RVGGLPRRHPRVEAQPGAARSDPGSVSRSPQGHRGDRGARADHQPAAARRLHPARERGGIGRPGCALHESAAARGQPRRRGEFVLPLQNPNAKSSDPVDDFTAEAAAWTLTAHEARPGHELQFAAMVEGGVSLARAAFAFNSTNAEGWGLYAESVMIAYFPPEG